MYSNMKSSMLPTGITGITECYFKERGTLAVQRGGKLKSEINLERVH